MAEDTIRTLKLRLCAPIPVGHEVTVQYFEKDTAVFTTEFEVDLDQPGVLDRTTGITYGSNWQPPTFFGWDEPARPQYTKSRSSEVRVDGIVRACAVLLDTSLNHGDKIHTVLTIETGGETYR